jgi:hypothetical protein
MPIARSIVKVEFNGANPADATVHSVYHDISSVGGLLPTDWSNHANQVRDCFSGSSSGYGAFTIYKNRKITVEVYDMADAKPRPQKATSIYTPSGATIWDPNTTEGFPQIAVCLSYYVDRNIRGQRGRLYLGPFTAPTGNAYTPPAYLVPGAFRTNLITLGHALFDVGGANVDHVLWSEKHQASVGKLTDYWVDDSWDVQRRRKVKSTSRTTLHP